MPSSIRQVRNLLKEPDFQRQTMILVASTIILMVITYLFGGIYFRDDAYIRFRYARNLADGYGISWNIVDAPTQGSTTFSFVLLIASGLKLGLSAEITAFILNTAGIIVIVFALHLSYRLICEDKSFLAILPAFVVIMYPGTLELVSSGMESIFWTGTLYGSLLTLIIYRDGKHNYSLIAFFIMAFFACLTRPESALIVALWFIYLLVITVGRQRLFAISGIIIFGIAGLIYVGWLQSYFGHILPNSFYIKVDSGLNSDGIEYIRGFLAFFILKPITIISVSGLIFLSRQKSVTLLIPHIMLLALLPVYLFTKPIQGFSFRFIHPVSVLIVFLLAFGGLYHFRLIREGIKGSQYLLIKNIQPLLSGIIWITALILFLSSFFVHGLFLLPAQISNGLANISSRDVDHPLWQAAYALSTVPDIENSSIIYGDAGILSYATMAYYIDPVGLNHTLIAHQAPERGSLWVVELLMEYNADLIIFYSNYDGSVFNQGDGIVGTHYSNLYLHPEFQNNYEEIVAFDYNYAISRWFVRIDSSYKEAFETALDPIAMENPPPIIP